MFWTVVVPDSAVAVDLAAGTARYAMTDVAVPDFHNFENSITAGANEPAHATFDVSWGTPSRSLSINNASQSFRGEFRETKVAIAFSTRNDSGFRFVSDPASTSNSLFGVIGTERNGVFYNAPYSPPAAPTTTTTATRPTVAGETSRRTLPATGGAPSLVTAGVAAVGGASLLRRIVAGTTQPE